LRRLGVNTCTVPQDSLADILDSYRQIGDLCNCRDAADNLASELQACLDRLNQTVTTTPRRRLLLTTGRDIRTGKLDEVYAVGRGTYLDELVTVLGCENIAPGNLLEYPAVSVEGILRLDPDIIIELVADMEYDEALEEAALQAWKSLPNLRAAQENRIHVLFGSYLTIPGPRVILALEALSRCLQSSTDATQ
jgi:iron complex transport system substrate-binding protein